MTSIRYKSTRGGEVGICFEEVVLGGLGKDRGLFVPEYLPKFIDSEIEQMRKMSYPELAFKVIHKFVQEDQIPSTDLRNIIIKSFASFRTTEVTPCVKLSQFWVLELFHGPTFAFKDVALQFLGNLFEYFLQRGRFRSQLNLLGATSGDTGSAAIYGVRGKTNIHCFVLFPFGKVSEIQERQMTSVNDKNIHTICIRGNFDDAQEIVKQCFSDNAFREQTQLGSINSINWARILVQISYYFYAWLRVTDGQTLKDRGASIDFVVPSGNFGDALAGYYAKRMGLNVGKVIVATNENKVLFNFFQKGIYKKMPVVQTLAPSMDISISSNLERYLYYLADESSELLASWMTSFEATEKLALPNVALERIQREFSSAFATKQEIVDRIKITFFNEHYLICPHTATAAVATDKLSLQGSTTVVLATAHPAKFEEAITLAIPSEMLPPRPMELEDILTLPTNKLLLAATTNNVKEYMKSCLSAGLVATTANDVAAVNESDDPLFKPVVTDRRALIFATGFIVVTAFILTRYWKKS